ncbi:MAG: hypothetical protein KatS3mg087_1794 [Patescibacteria group bacterium]|nr:MAG: hypothetical protein KatS3mg087_1794 [Patescibacteria group bacterium]
MIDVTVILPVYNAIENYKAGTLERAVESVVQSVGVQVQLIVVDDGSTDETYNTVKALLSDTDIESKLYRNKTNKGVGFSTAKGAKYAVGRYMMYLPVRAWLEQDTLAKLVGALDNAKAERVAFAYPSIQYSGKWNFKRVAPAFDKFAFTKEFLANFMVWRSELYQDIRHRDVLNLDDGTILSAHDYDFCLQIIHYLGLEGIGVPDAFVYFEHSDDPNQGSNLLLKHRNSVRKALAELNGVAL